MYVCVSRLEDAVRVIHMGVVSAAGVIFLFAASSACPCSLSKSVCVCVLAKQEAGCGAAVLSSTHPSPPLLETVCACEDHVGGEMAREGEREKVWEGGEAEEK